MVITIYEAYYTELLESVSPQCLNATSLSATMLYYCLHDTGQQRSS